MDLVKECRTLLAARGVETDEARFSRLLEVAWDRSLERSPEMASVLGVPGHDDRWSDLSLEAVERTKAEDREVLAVLGTVDRDQLSQSRRVDFDLFREQTELAVEGAQFPDHLLALSQMGGVHTTADILVAMNRSGVAGYENALSRLRRLPTAVEQTIALLEEGIARGIVQPRVILRDVPDAIQAQVVDDPTTSSFFLPFATFPTGFSQAEQENISREARAVIAEAVVPAMQRLHEFVVDRYLPACRTETLGLSALPDGNEWYAHRVRRFTTTTLTPEGIHDLGRREVERIGAEMDALAAVAGFDRDLPAYVDYLQTEPSFYFDSSDELVEAYRALCKRIDAELPKLFRTLPRLPYGVTAVPDHNSRSGPTAYYMGGSFDAARPGMFYANTYALGSRPRWEMEALALHEAVPGHHLQVALAAELVDIPPFRRFGGYTAYAEGWGLYAESLGAELGLYTETSSRFGQLAFEMWRAVRLVVDTGVHALGWTRQQAIEFFRARAGRAEHDVVTEVDRYIALPGQALAYKIGELEIQSLRRLAAEQLGERFDVREFHDVVLREGAVPLAVLRSNVEAWLKSA